MGSAFTDIMNDTTCYQKLASPKMKQRRGVVTIATIALLLYTNVALAQTSPQPNPKLTPNPQDVQKQPKLGISPNDELKDTERQLTELKEKVTALEAREKAISETYYNHIGWIGLLFGGLGIALGFITFSPVLAGIIIWLLRKTILRELSRKIEEEIKLDIDSLRKKTNRDMENVKNEIDESIKPKYLEISQLESKIKELNNFETEIISARKIMNDIKRHLDIGTTKNEEIENLKTGIINASELTQDNIFFEAKDFLVENFRRNKLKEIEKTIPIFEAIIDSDGKDGKKEYFRSRVYLAYGYAYKEPPDYGKAIELINEAIQIRNELNKYRPEFYFYEFKRAIYNLQKQCSIEDADASIKIEKDLETAKQYPTVRRLLEELPNVRAFDQEFQEYYGRLINKSEFEILKKWYKQTQK
ncbi:hypothetical protein ACE1AT_23715 [Pelatocladus sp. BLCC-F211]|uniref:hypothetical protein n=1 Tax=Pelatocladus sp. BLCC-F211 TaxID=3342752 RepID=UPI0035B79A91